MWYSRQCDIQHDMMTIQSVHHGLDIKLCYETNDQINITHTRITNLQANMFSKILRLILLCATTWSVVFDGTRSRNVIHPCWRWVVLYVFNMERRFKVIYCGIRRVLGNNNTALIMRAKEDNANICKSINWAAVNISTYFWAPGLGWSLIAAFITATVYVEPINIDCVDRPQFDIYHVSFERLAQLAIFEYVRLRAQSTQCST